MAVKKFITIFFQKQPILGSSEGSVECRFCLYQHCQQKDLWGVEKIPFEGDPHIFLCLFLEGLTDWIE